MSITHNCAPSLNDQGVLEFCKHGYLLLERVVPDDINRRIGPYLDAHPGLEPSGILLEPWFVEQVILNPSVIGIIRSLLGASFGLPVHMASHRRQCPLESTHGWHVDGGSRWTPEVNDLQVFYYPQDTPLALGPTEVLPGSHQMPMIARAMGHYGHIKGARSTAAPRGSIFITMYRIWHRPSPSTATGIRDMLKYCYFRTTLPQRDWRIEPTFDLSKADLRGPAASMGEQFQDCVSAAEMYAWLSGKYEQFQFFGGQAWPVPGPRIGLPYGFPAAFEAHTPIGHGRSHI